MCSRSAPVRVGVLAVEDDGIGRVPLFDDLQAAVDLSAQLGIGEVVAGEDRPAHAAELFKRLVGGMFGSTAGEAAQD